MRPIAPTGGLTPPRSPGVRASIGPVEIERRIEAYDAGQTRGSDATTALEHIRRRLAEHRERLESIEKIRAGLDSLEQGHTLPVAEVFERIRRTHNLPD